MHEYLSENIIEKNAGFFEQCAKDYRELAHKLTYELEAHLKINIKADCPIITFNQLKRGDLQSGKFGDWKYFIHGYHCGFENLKTKQHIEASLVFGLEFGVLDPYFFSNFILSTTSYCPLPYHSRDAYSEGVKILNKMLELGKFEKIDSNFENHWGIIVKDRDKVEVRIYKGET